MYFSHVIVPVLPASTPTNALSQASYDLILAALPMLAAER
jgi:hypothetical protein